jgi:hypothetical protein
MKPTFSIFVAATLLLGSGAAEAAHRASTLMLPHPSCHLGSTDTLYQSDRGCRHRSKLWRVARQSRIAHMRKEAQAQRLRP